MKSFLTFLFMFCVSLPLLAQNTETRNLSGFTKLGISVPAEVKLTKGPFKVILKGEDLEEILTTVKGNELVIKAKKDNSNFFGRDADDLLIEISMPSLDGIALNGSGTLESNDSFNSKQMKLQVSGSGSMLLGSLSADNIDAHVSGSGTMRLKVNTQKFGAHIAGSGQIQAAGAANTMEAHISGSGKVKADDLKAKSADVHISGSGDCNVHADEKLEAHISGSGNVHYTGNPTNVNSRTSGSGKIVKKG